MSYNRLWLVGPKGELFLLAKSDGSGWDVWDAVGDGDTGTNRLAELQKWLEEVEDPAQHDSQALSKIGVCTDYMNAPET